MKIIRTRDYEEMSRQAADLVCAQILRKPDCVLGLATGASPEGIYHLLTARYARGELDFSRVSTVNLDEYCDLPRTNTQSYWHYMQAHLFAHVNLDLARTHIPDGTAADPAAECARYDALLRRLGGVDLQLLGIGRNGHIGFNEPGEAFTPGTHLVTLADSTVDANRRYFARREDVPRQAITMGIRDILQARHIVVIVSGGQKAGIVRRAFCGPITPAVPASILQLHPDLTLIGDAEALAGLPDGA